jgi:hypothetical protein
VEGYVQSMQYSLEEALETRRVTSPMETCILLTCYEQYFILEIVKYAILASLST